MLVREPEDIQLREHGGPIRRMIGRFRVQARQGKHFSGALKVRWELKEACRTAQARGKSAEGILLANATADLCLLRFLG